MTGTDRAGTGSTNRPNVVSGQDPNDGPNTILQWFNTAAFVQQPTGTYGDAVRNSIVGPGIFNFDMSILRNFALGGSKSLQFRLEAFNVWNWHIFSNAGEWGGLGFTNDIASPDFGKWNGSVTDPRSVQLAVRFEF